MVGSKCRDFKNREVSNVNAPNMCFEFAQLKYETLLSETLCSIVTLFYFILGPNFSLLL